MKKRTISTSTILEPYGLVRISGEAGRNPFYNFEERQFEPEFEISGLRVVDAQGKVLQGRIEPAKGATYIHCGLDQYEVEKCEEVLIEKFLDDEQAYQDTLIDEAIQRGRELARHAYE